MSNLKQQNGDDYPDAACKHLGDANALISVNRFDGAAYLAGYVVECSLKSLIQVETGKARRNHRLADLTRYVIEVCMVAGARTAKYMTSVVQRIPSAGVGSWRETLRYRSPSMTRGEVETWVKEAGEIYSSTVAAMILDGVIR
jgi:HEPN domain-containing protein